jgi:drug/metabolite transporter (DMT)-like permease
MTVDRRMAHLGLGIAIIFWGASFVATKLVVQWITPAGLTMFRLFQGVVVLLLLARNQKSLWSFPRKWILSLVLLGFLGTTFHQWLQAEALRTTQATIGSWIVATIPVMVGILGRVFLNERLGKQRTLGIIFAALGAMLVISGGNLIELFKGVTGTRGDFLFVASALNWAVFTILSRRMFRGNDGKANEEKGPGPMVVLLYIMSFGFLFSLPWAAWQGIWIAEPAFSPVVVGAVLFLGLACSGLAYAFWFRGLEQIDASQAAAYLYFEPLVNVLVAGFVLGKAMTRAAFAGAAAILIGVWLVNRPVN